MSLFQNKKTPDLSWPAGEVGKAFVDEKTSVVILRNRKTISVAMT